MSDTKVRDEPIEQHLPVSGLILNIVRDLGIRTVGDLCSLDIKTVEQVKGVGIKKIAEFKRLIEMSQQLAGIAIGPVSDARVELTGTVFEQATLLVFVPSILKVAFEQIKIDTVEKLLALDVAELDALPGWGAKKKAAVAGIKELYSRLAMIQLGADFKIVGDLVPKEVLPTECIGRTLLDKFMTGQYGESLRGKALQEAHDLRMLLTHAFATKYDEDSIADMEWRDVPLQVGVKVEAVADRYNLMTVRQLEAFAIYGRILDPKTGELIDVNGMKNFGDSSLADLREELHRLKRLGLKEYRKHLGISFDGNGSAEEIMEWRSVPLQVGVKVEAVADRYGLITIGQLVNFAMYGRVVDTATQELVDVLRAGNFGESSLTALRDELTRFKSMGLKGYRQHVGCDFCSRETGNVPWSEIPLRIGKRIQDFLRSQGIETVAEVQQLALRKQVFSKPRGEWLPVSEFENFSERSIEELRDELRRLDSEGLELYRFGKAGAPKTLRECVARAISGLNSRQIDMLKARFSGATLEHVAQQFAVTKERVRQIVSSAYKDLFVYRISASALYSFHESALPHGLYWDSEQILTQLDLEQGWHIDFLFELIELPYERISSSIICRVPSASVDLLRDWLRKLLKAEPAFSIRKISTIGELLVTYEAAIPTNQLPSSSLEDFAECELTIGDLHTILGEDWLRASIRSQIIDAGVNGIAFRDIDSAGAFVDPNILEEFLGDEAVRLNGDIFRRNGEMYDRAEEVLDIIRAADGPVDTEYIIDRSKRKWHQAPLVGNYLSRLYEVVSTGRGVYLHIDKLGLSIEEVKKVAKWGAELLAGENRSIDGNELLDLYHSSGLPQKIENAYQLVSILAKHSDVRRLSNNLQLAHRISFDETELSLANGERTTGKRSSNIWRFSN